jgi:predicted site-specific integrase-resolvase
MEDRNLVTPSGACEFLRVHQSTLTKLIEAGELVPVTAEAETYLRREDVVALRSKREGNRKIAIQNLLELGEDE